MIKINISALTSISEPFNRDMVVKQINEEIQLVHSENEAHNPIQSYKI
jgi:hypothetical protein